LFILRSRLSKIFQGHDEMFHNIKEYFSVTNVHELINNGMCICVNGKQKWKLLKISCWIVNGHLDSPGS
jgi:hypothetical protein